MSSFKLQTECSSYGRYIVNGLVAICCLELYTTVAEFSAAKVRKLDVVTEECVKHLNAEENGKGKNPRRCFKMFLSL